MLKLETERLILRDLIPDDCTLFLAMSNEEKITKYQKWFMGENGCQQWLEEAIKHNERIPRFAYNMAIVLKNNRQAIGWIGWGAHDLEKREYSFGYALLPEFWEKGIMTEALKCGIKYMFEELNANIVSDHCVDDNPGSARVMEKAGLVLTKEWEEINKETQKLEKHKFYSIENKNSKWYN